MPGGQGQRDGDAASAGGAAAGGRRRAVAMPRPRSPERREIVVRDGPAHCRGLVGVASAGLHRPDAQVEAPT